MKDEHGSETNIFSLHASVRFDMTFKVNEPVDMLYVSIILFTGNPKTAVTSVYQSVTGAPLVAGKKGRVVLDLPELNLRPGEYSLYFWLGKNEATSFDVVDDIVPPMMIETKDDFEQLGYNPANPMGFFDLTSRVAAYSEDQDSDGETLEYPNRSVAK